MTSKEVHRLQNMQTADSGAGGSEVSTVRISGLPMLGRSGHSGKSRFTGWRRAACAATVVAGVLAQSTAAGQSLAEALNATNLTWTTGGTTPWFVQNTVTHDGAYAVRSGTITHNQVNWIQTAVTGPGVLSFWWKVSSEFGYDFLILSIDGTDVAAVSGEVDWQRRSFYLGTGAHTVRWAYTKDVSVTTGLDASWLDEVSFIPGEGAPLILVAPQSRGLALGQSATLAVSAGGTEPLGYQWIKDGADMPGGTNATLPITNFQGSDVGAYCVVVTNALGAVTSQVAVITQTSIFTWGGDGYGQASVPAGLSNVLAVACGDEHTLAVRLDGTVIAWGRNDLGQTNVPAGLSNVVAVTAGEKHTVALRSGGTVVAWGQHFAGPYTPYYVPMIVPNGLSNVVAVSSGKDHALALKANGTVAAWGGNYAGEATVPTGLTNVVAVAAGTLHNLALRANGSVFAWGGNDNGQTNVPAGLNSVVKIAAGAYHNLALRADGRVFAWGSYFSGETNVPPDLSEVVAVAAGSRHSLALRADGGVVAWGWNNSGQTNVPAGLTNAIVMAGGLYHSMAVVGSGPPTRRALALNPIRNAAGFSVQIQTECGRVYALEYKQTLGDPNWVALPLVAGNGGLQTLTDPTAPVGARFYRVRAW